MKNKLLVLSLVTLIFSMSSLRASEIKNTKNDKQPSIPQLLEQSGIPGLSLAKIYSDGTFTINNYGVESIDTQVNVNDETVFEAASLSKPVLSYIVLKLVEDNKLTLETPLHTIYEDPRFDNQSYAKLLTPRLILSHQSGLPNWGDRDLKFQFKPGSKFQYSGEAYVYLQKCLERLTNLDYQSLAKRKVFEPLKMTNSRFTWLPSEKIKKATGHNRALKPQTRGIPEVNAASSLHTTAKDYAKFLTAWFDEQYISSELRESALSPYIVLPATFGGSDASTESSKDTQLGWGLGWGLFKSPSNELAWHWGDNGVFRAFTVLDLKQRKAMVYFTNSQNGLSIAKAVSKISNFDITPIITWLGYGQSDSELWQAMFKGYLAEAKQNYKQAINLFRKVVEAFPENNSIANRILWMETLLKSEESDFKLDNAKRKLLVGEYGDRKIELIDGKLLYSRSGREKHELKPMSENLFSVGNSYEFRLEAEYENNKVVKLIGHYINGYSDQSFRTD